MHWIRMLLSLTVFGVEHIPTEIKKFIDNENVQKYIFRIERYDSVICGYFCTVFIVLCLKVKA